MVPSCGIFVGTTLLVLFCIWGQCGRVQNYYTSGLRSQADKSLKNLNQNVGDNEEQAVVNRDREDDDSKDTTSKKSLSVRVPFQRSNITRLTSGMDLFEFVCIHREPAGRMGKRHILKFHAYSGGRLEGHPVNLGTIADHPPDQWFIDSNQTVIVRQPTMAVMTVADGNPAHCINDVAVPIATGYDYIPEHYTGLTWSDFLPVFPKDRVWCWETMRRTGLIPDNYVAPPPPQQLPTRHHPMMCFERLMVPRVVKMRSIPDDASAQALRFMRSRLCQSLNFTEEAWTTAELSKNTVSILLYDRQGTDRRRLVDSTAIQKELEDRYQAQVTLLQEDWDSYNYTQQLELYNSASYVIAPHGAHLANLLVSRPKTRVVEVVCATTWGQRTNNLLVPPKSKSHNNNKSKQCFINMVVQYSSNVKLATMVFAEQCSTGY